MPANTTIVALIDTLDKIGQANNYLRGDVENIVDLLDQMQDDELDLEEALLIIPDMYEPFLNFIGIIDVELSNEFMDLYGDQIDWSQVSASGIFKKLPNSFIMKYADSLDWLSLSWSGVDESIMRLYPERLEWESICYHHILSDKFMRDHVDYIDWKYLSMKQRFSLEMIREWETKLVMCDNIADNIHREHAALELINIDGVTSEISALVASYL